MKKITEEFLHFLWRNQQLAGVVLNSESRQKLEILNPGVQNPDAGPDFFNARIRIDGTIWAGNIELHINASDWLRHNHQEDEAYDSVILHVVYYHDCVIRARDGRIIPVATIRFPVMLWETYNSLMNNSAWVSCEEHLSRLGPVEVAQWTSRLMIEKLEKRYAALDDKMLRSVSHWESLLHHEIFRCFGLHVNMLPFEMLARAVPFEFVLRNRQSLYTLEAILFGQAGMLDQALPVDAYTEGLRNEYLRLKPRLPRQQVPAHLWKYARMRPGAFPSLRIALLSALIHRRYPLMEFLLDRPEPDDLRRHFRVKAGDYWNTHYIPGRISKEGPRYPGEDFINRLIINGIVPYLFYYGEQNGIAGFRDYCISLLEEIPPESNHVIKKWAKFGVRAANAFESQALLFLYRNYCKQNRCLACQFGNSIIIYGKITV